MKNEINLYNAYIFVFCFNYYRGFQRVVYIYIYIYIYGNYHRVVVVCLHTLPYLSLLIEIVDLI